MISQGTKAYSPVQYSAEYLLVWDDEECVSLFINQAERQWDDNRTHHYRQEIECAALSIGTEGRSLVVNAGKQVAQLSSPHQSDQCNPLLQSASMT